MLSKDLPNKELGLDDMVDTPHQANTDNLWLDDMLDTNKWKESKAEESTETESKSEDAKEGEGVEPEESTEDKSEWDKEPKDLLWDILSWIDEQDDSIDEVQESTDSVIKKTDEAKEAVKDGDLHEAVSLLEEMNNELISVKADLGKYETEANIYRDKLAEVNKELSETKANYQENPTIDNAELAKLNRMYTSALDGDESYVSKVKDTLEDMYHNITWNTFEEDEVSKANKWVTDKWSLWELSSPIIEAKPKKEEKKFDANQWLDMEDFLW